MIKVRAEAKGVPTTRVTPPSNIDWLVEVLGVDGALEVVEKCGGTQLHVPNGTAPQEAGLKRFKQRFGEALAHDLMRYFGGGVIIIPICAQWLTEVYAARGMPPVQIARKLRCTTSTIWRRLNRSTKPKRHIVTFSAKNR